ncbi:MAG: hypothetical protein RBQ97_06850 [Acholeplasma sp.]|nr:hypothetical protein [Acholeplasma sp.]
MTYAMTLDNSWELMSEEEMYDVNGGKNHYDTMTATAAVNLLGAGLLVWLADAVGYSSAAALLAAPTLGLGSIITGIIGGYSGWMASLYLGAYNQANDIVDQYGGSQMVTIKTTTILFLGVTAMSCYV